MKVTKNIIPNKKKLQITVSSTTTKEEGGVTKFAIKTDEDAYLIYAIKKEPLTMMKLLWAVRS